MPCYLPEKCGHIREVTLWQEGENVFIVISSKDFWLL